MSGLRKSVLCCLTLVVVLHGVLSLKPYHDPNYVAGRDVIIHLFEWKWNDIALECERYLAPMGYAGVQVSPPNENVIVVHPDFQPEAERPWYERYQPISYKLVTRSGNEDEFKEMVRRCNNVGVRIYVDAVINHMTGDFPKGTVGTDGSGFDNDGPSYPEVPYGPEDFNEHGICQSPSGNIENYGDVNQVRNCKLVDLHDLNHKRQHVQQMIDSYLNMLLAIGVAGFRIDASKHMWPEDLAIIYNNLSNLSTEYFDAELRPLIYQEVIDLGGESATSDQYSQMGRVTEFKYGMKLGDIFRGHDKTCYLRNFGEEWGLLPSDDALVFIDNHDNQRGHGAGGLDTILTFFDGQLYKMASVFMLAWPYGLKQVMSSYRWNRNIDNGVDHNNWIGPPHDNNFNILPVAINSENGCDNGWVCEHRFPEIANMVTFSIVAGDEPVVNWWDNGNNQIAFSRGHKAFLALNNDNAAMEVKVETHLPPGIYCDVTSGTFGDDVCHGNAVTVHSDNFVYVALAGGQNAMMAIHGQAMIRSSQSEFCATEDGSEEDFRRTVLLVYVETQYGDSVFVRGGVSFENRPGCNENAENCLVPIKHIDDGCRDDAYVAWKTNDDFLDWNGAETQQQSYNGQSASGTPLFWSTNDESNPSYNKFNRFGPNYWVMDVEMDCSKTYGQWFEFKVVLSGDRWEWNIGQDNICYGANTNYRKPFPSNNHMGMCGKINVYKFQSGECQINEF